MQNRREFIRNSALFTSALAAAPYIAVGQGAPRVFKAGLIGCGGRGNGAVGNLIEAARELGHEVKVVAVADFFADKAQAAANKFGCDAKMAFAGASSYRKVIETDCEIVVLTAPPGFRPIHLEAAVKAGKHVFAEKPVAVDGAGVRQFLAASAEARNKKLAIVAGTQRRHQGSYISQAKALRDGKIGPVLGGAIYWNGNVPWIHARRQGDTNADYMANNWLNWVEMSGDHICEQHVHNIDIANWFIGRAPQTATGFGGRMRRKTGNQYDFFSVDYDYGEGVHIHSMCRQIPGCNNFVGERLRSADAQIMGGGKVLRADGSAIELEDAGSNGNPYVNEHRDLLQGILNGEVLNEGEAVAMSTAAAIAGRVSAYTGRTVRMSDLLTNEGSEFYNMNCKPSAADFETGKDVELPAEDTAPVPGQ